MEVTQVAKNAARTRHAARKVGIKFEDSKPYYVIRVEQEQPDIA
jgi:hypothetical protein